MTKHISTSFGEQLSADSKRLLSELRLKIQQPIHPNFNTDFNLYRFILATERGHKKGKEIIDAAAKLLNNHLRIRKALDLDEQSDVPFETNELFEKKYLPMGTIQSATDSSNRLLWYVEYATIDVESLSYAISSSYAIRLQFLQYEHMLRLVNKQEEKTGQLSGLRHIIDLTGYEINPFTMIFVTNGSLAYYSQLFHFENYPELVSPIEMVNISKWIHVPYRLAKGMMPTGFVERFRLHDADFLRALQKDIKMEDIPTSLGGKNEHIRCVPAAKLASDMHWKPNSPDFLDTLEKIQLAPRKVRQISIDITESNQHLAWYFSTDGDMCFGIFYQETEGLQGTSNVSINSHTENDIDIDKLKMVYPYLKLSARLVHEYDSIKCTRAGRYWMILSNKLSWLHRRTINLCIKVADETFSNVKRYHTDGVPHRSGYGWKEMISKPDDLTMTIKQKL